MTESFRYGRSFIKNYVNFFEVTSYLDLNRVQS